MAGHEGHAVGAGKLRLRKTEAAEGGEEENDVEQLQEEDERTGAECGGRF